MRNDTISHEVRPNEIVRLADERDLDVFFQIEDFDVAAIMQGAINRLVNSATRWFDAGAVHLVLDPGETGSIGRKSRMKSAEAFASEFGLHTVMFLATNHEQQEDFLSFFGEEVHLCDVPPMDISKVERLRNLAAYSGTAVSGTRL